MPTAPDCDERDTDGCDDQYSGDERDPGGGDDDGPARGSVDGDCDDTALSLVVNALADLHADERVTLEDAPTVDAVGDAYRAATDAGTRASFEAALAARFEHVEADGTGSVDGKASSADDRDLLAVVRSVTAELDGRGASFRVTHDVPVSHAALDAGLYRFARTRDPEPLLALDVSDAVTRRFDAAADALREERYDAAAWALVDAVGNAAGGDATRDEAIATRLAAGWARHWAGDHDDALDLVEETLHLDTRSWPARQLALAVRHDSPEFFRENRLAAAVYLRARVTEPEGTGVTAAMGYQSGSATDDGSGRATDDRSGDATDDRSGDATAWRDLPGPLTCVPLDDLPRDGTLRFELRGNPRAMPTLQTYYLGLGVVEPTSHRARTVDHVLLDGPHPDASETLRVRIGEE